MLEYTYQIKKLKKYFLLEDGTIKWVDDKMIPYYPLGVYKDRTAANANKEDAQCLLKNLTNCLQK